MSIVEQVAEIINPEAFVECRADGIGNERGTQQSSRIKHRQGLMKSTACAKAEGIIQLLLGLTTDNLCRQMWEYEIEEWRRLGMSEELLTSEMLVKSVHDKWSVVGR